MRRAADSVARLLAAAIACGALAMPGTAAAAERPAKPAAASEQVPPHKKAPTLDLSGRKRVGKASFYAKKFNGRKMADGTRMNPQQHHAASKTLPLGTTAKVTNLETGQSAVVTIRDRGPYVAGRIVDLTPATAEKVGLDRKEGLATVEVAPIAVPQPDGSVKPGAAAADPSVAPATAAPGGR
ncbi:MAG: septal ring lytic transglycosylase RlpA family protein [Pseudomonadota bacterium]